MLQTKSYFKPSLRLTILFVGLIVLLIPTSQALGQQCSLAINSVTIDARPYSDGTGPIYQSGDRVIIVVNATITYCTAQPPPTVTTIYEGALGDTSNPVLSNPSNNGAFAVYYTPPLTKTTSYWARVTATEGTSSATKDSSTVTVTVTPAPSPTPTPTPVVTPTPTPTPPSPTATPTPTPTPTPIPSPAGFVQFSSTNYSAGEGDRDATITVSRSGDVSAAATVDYAASDGTAHQRTDYTLTTGTLSFAPGESTKIFTVLLIDNAYVDGNRTINLALGNPNGTTLGALNSAVLTISDNDSAHPTNNPIDDARFFVRQQYLDFLNREPDAGGWDYWTSLFTNCPGADAQCVNSKRVTVSAAFFIEQEFQLTGNYVYRMYKAAFGQRPTYAQFIPDRARLNPDASQIETSKQQFADQFVRRPEFLAKYPLTLSPEAFVDALIATVKTETNGAVDLSAQRSALVTAVQTSGRGSVVRQAAETKAFQNAEYNKAFVTMQYFGYLRRDPEDGGYNFWLDVLNNRLANNYRGMVCAFTNSAEYQSRFSPLITRNDSICGSIGP